MMTYEDDAPVGGTRLSIDHHPPTATDLRPVNQMEYFDFPLIPTDQAGPSSGATLPAGTIKQEDQEGSVKTPVGTPLGPPGVVTVSTAFHPTLTFDGAPPDLILVSSDGVHFYVHRLRLITASTNFLGGLLPADYSEDVKPSALPLVHVQQNAEVLNVVLHTMYGISCLHYYPALEVVDAALDALELYGAPVQALAAPNQPLYHLLLTYAPFRPIDAYAVAAHHSLEDAAVAISSHLLAYDLGRLPDEAAQKMGPIYLKRLFVLHQSRIVALRNILFRPPAPHPPTPGCTPEIQQKLTRAWALAAAQLVWDVLPSVSTMALRSLLEPIATKLECQQCAASLLRRVQEVVYEWSAVKRSI
ncbi:hypothetical protein FKP32DRAFT_1040011 [Trametes sanguinea]|nr:hypothetical protein FKP32DRAFT_1040011 [Trametes sanguinea]